MTDLPKSPVARLGDDLHWAHSRPVPACVPSNRQAETRQLAALAGMASARPHSHEFWGTCTAAGHESAGIMSLHACDMQLCYNRAAWLQQIGIGFSPQQCGAMILSNRWQSCNAHDEATPTLQT